MKDPQFVVLAHIQNVGDVTGGPGDFVGRRGQSRRMEGFSVTLRPPIDGIALRYMAHISFEGDTRWMNGGEFVGSRGRSRAVQGFAIELTGANLAKYDVEYMAHIGYRGDTAWVSNGQFCGTRGESLEVEGMAVKIVPRKPNYIVLVSRAASVNDLALVITAPEDDKDFSVRVSAPDGTDYQQWDRRPVQGGRGFALISKARPTLCIARGSGPPVELKPVTQIDSDPTCVWRDDGVNLPPYNAINSWTDWEQKLHLSGTAPYPDKDNRLITHPWSHRADNELWRQSRTSYRVVAGTDAEALNVLAKAIYTGCYPNVFKGKFEIGGGIIESVAYDILEPPVIEIKRSAPFERHVRERYSKLPGVSPADVEKMAAEVAASSFTVTLERMRLTVVDQNGTREVDARIEMAATVQWNPDHSISIELSYGEISIPEDPALALLLAGFVLLLIAYLNLEVLSGIRIPPLELLGVEFAAPALRTVQPHVLAATTILPDTSTQPPPSNWPRDKVFVGFDDFALNAVARPALEGLRIGAEWKPAPIPIFLCDLDVSANAAVNLRNPVLTRTDRDNTYSARIDLTGSASFRIKCGILPALTVSASASGSVTVTASVSVDAGNHVSLTIRSVDSISLSWRFLGLPLWLTFPMVAAILKVFEPFITAIISTALRNRVFRVYTIPTISVQIAGKTFDITLRDLTLGRGEDGGGKPLVLTTGLADVRMR